MDRSAQALDFAREAEVQRKPPYHPYRPLDGGRIDGVYDVIALALPKGTTAEGISLVYPSTAQCFAEFSSDSNYGLIARYMLQAFVLGCNMTEKGCPWLSLPKDHHKESEAVAALCRKVLHAPQKKDKEKFYHMFRGGALVDVELAKIVKTSLDKGYAPSAGGGGGGGGEEEPPGESLGSEDSDEGDEEEEDNLEAAPRMERELEAMFGDEAEEGADLDPVPMEVEEEGEAEDDEPRNRIEVMSSSSSSEEEEIGLVNPEGDELVGNEASVEAAIRARRGPSPSPEGRRAREANMHVAEHYADELLDGVLKERISEKVHVIYQDFTDDRDDSVGGIMWFFQLDPLFNMGEVISEIVKNKKERDEAIIENYVGSKRRGYNVYREKWPNLSNDKDHVIHHLTDMIYRDIAAEYTGNSTLRTDPSNVTMSDVWDFDKRGTPDSPNPYFPTKVFTPHRALEIMRAAGAKESQCNIANHRPQAQWDDYVPENGQSWCVPSDKSYWFHHKTVFWHRYGKVGLSGLCFPNISLQKRINTDSMALVPTQFDLQIMPTMGQFLSTQTGGMMQLVQTVPWDPNAKVKKDHIHQLTIENKSFRKDLPVNPEVEGEEFSAYCRALSKFKQGAIAKAAQVLKAGNPYISKPMQNILKWEKENNIRKVSTYLPHSMPTMDTFANMVIRDAGYAKHHRHIASEVRWWLLCHYGLMDCYHYDHEVHLNVIFHGMSQTGKSYFLFDATQKSWIPGTILDILEESNRASNTDEAVVDWCIIKDEVEDIIVDGHKAEKDKSGRAEREKSKLTNCRLTYKVLVLKQNERGGTDRVAEYIETDFVTSCGCATNKQVKVKGDEALASRFAKFTICRPGTDVYEYMGIGNKLSAQSRKKKDDMKTHLRIVQGIIAKVQKLIQGEVIGEPSMDVFNVLIARMLSYLKDQGFDVSEQRQIQLMERYAYQLTIRKAVFDLYMKPGAPLFGKPFSLQDMIAHGDWLDEEKAREALDEYNDGMTALQAAQEEYDRNNSEYQDILKSLALNPGEVAEKEILKLEKEQRELYSQTTCLDYDIKQAGFAVKRLKRNLKDAKGSALGEVEKSILAKEKEIKKMDKKRKNHEKRYFEIRNVIQQAREDEKKFYDEVKRKRVAEDSQFIDMEREDEPGVYEQLETNNRRMLMGKKVQLKRALGGHEKRIAVHYKKVKEAFSGMEGSPGIEPFLVCTKQITIFVWTKMGEMLVDPVAKIVLEGMAKVAGVKRKDGDGVEELFRKDKENLVPWEKSLVHEDNVVQSGDGEQVNRVIQSCKLNLNYFEIECMLKDLAALVSENTQPRVSPQDCSTYIDMMKRKYIRVCTYHPLDQKTVSSLTNTGGTLNRQTIPLKQTREPKTIPIIRNNYQDKKTYIAVDAFERYNVELLMEAVTFCLYDGWRDGQKFLFGLPFEKYTEVFQTMEVTKGKGSLIPLMKRDPKGLGFVFMWDREPVVDQWGNQRRDDECEVILSKSNKKIIKKKYMKDESGAPIYAEVPELEAYGRGKFRPKTDRRGNQLIKRCQAYEMWTKVQYPVVNRWGEVVVREATEQEKEREGVHEVTEMEVGWLISKPILVRQDAGLIDKYSMGEAFYVPEEAYIDNVTSDLLYGVSADPNLDIEDMILDPSLCDRKEAVVEITEDLDDWGLKKHCLREGIDSHVIRTIASIPHSMEFVAAHVRWDPVFSKLYKTNHDYTLLEDYPNNIIRSIEKKMRERLHARDFEKAKKRSRIDAELRRQSVNVSSADWRSHLNSSKSQDRFKRGVDAYVQSQASSSLSSFFRQKRGRDNQPRPKRQAPRAESPVLTMEQARRKTKRKKTRQERFTMSAEQTAYVAMDNEATRLSASDGGDGAQSPTEFVPLNSATFDSVLGAGFE